MKVYVKLNDDNIITDAITYPFGDYIEIELNNIPVGINGGWYKYENGVCLEIPELNPLNIENRIDEASKKAKEQQLLELIEGGLI